MPTQAEFKADLEDLYVARRNLVAGIANNKNVVEYEIRNRKVKYTDPIKALVVIREEIKLLERKIDRGPARNFVSVGRRYR